MFFNLSSFDQHCYDYTFNRPPCQYQTLPAARLLLHMFNSKERGDMRDLSLLSYFNHQPYKIAV